MSGSLSSAARWRGTAPAVVARRPDYVSSSEPLADVRGGQEELW